MECGEALLVRKVERKRVFLVKKKVCMGEEKKRAGWSRRGGVKAVQWGLEILLGPVMADSI